VVYADSSTRPTGVVDETFAQFWKEWEEERNQEIPKFEREGTVKYLQWKSSEEDKGKLDEKVDSMDKKVESMDKKVDNMDKKIDKKVDSVDKKVDNIVQG